MSEEQPSVEIVDAEPVIEPKLGQLPVLLQCPNCGTFTYTLVQTKPSEEAWCLGFLFFIFFWPLTCLPCVCMEPAVQHYCPHCTAQIV